jgi:glyoxylase-like metal-dependent hydrolase (beta-lactamase superfamily II)
MRAYLNPPRILPKRKFMPVSTCETYRDLEYPWGKQGIDAGSPPLEVAPGVFWARFPMFSSLDHINLWLLADGDGWTIVDCCLDLPESRRVWESLFAGVMGDKPIKRIICTHLHPDHVGLAGWLSERFNAELLMTRQEFLMCRTLVGDTGKDAPSSALNFYRAAGYSEADIDDYNQRFGSFGKIVYPLPQQYRRISDRETLCIGGEHWQVVVGNGHSPEHACLYCPSLKLLISGDQILPNISSNISVFPLEPHGNPLRDWLGSCRLLHGLLPPDLLVLPAHESPFYGVDARLLQLIEEHENDINALYQFLDAPKRVVDCFPALFKREIGRADLGLATGEALAHLNYLIDLAKVSCTTDSNGVNWYCRSAEKL